MLLTTAGSSQKYTLTKKHQINKSANKLTKNRKKTILTTAKCS